MPLRVAHLLPNMAVGGRERMVAALCAKAGAGAVQPFVIGYDTPDQATPMIEVDAPTIQLDRKSRDFGLRLRQALADHGIDLVHAQGHVAAHLLNRTRAFPGPKIVTTHIGMQGSWRWLPQIRAGLRHMDRIYAVSAPMAKLYRRISGCTVSVIANGISLPDPGGPIANPPLPGACFRFAMLSRLDPVKRHGDAIACIDRLVADGYDATLTIAGDGVAFAALKSMADRRPHVDVIGPVADIGGFLARQHGFILCSQREGMPMALIEAMAAGLPIVASAVGGIPEMMGDVGQLVPPRDRTSLANAMAGLIDNRTDWHRMSRRAIERSRDFDALTMAARYRAEYNPLVLPHSASVSA